MNAALQVELKATCLELIGECNADTYPLQKKKHTLEYLRSIAHLRPRTNTLGAVTRVRSALAFATHQFFREAGFQYIHTPILSGSDCEGAGEMFQVLTASLLLVFLHQDTPALYESVICIFNYIFKPKTAKDMRLHEVACTSDGYSAALTSHSRK